VKDLDDAAQVLSVAAFAALAPGPQRKENPDQARAQRWIRDLDRARRNPGVSRADGLVAELSNRLSDQIRRLREKPRDRRLALNEQLCAGLQKAQSQARRLGMEMRDAHEAAAKAAVGILRLAVRRCVSARQQSLRDDGVESEVDSEAAAMRAVLTKSRQTHERDLVRLAASLAPLASQAETVLRDLPSECPEAEERANEAAEIGRSMREIPRQRTMLSDAGERVLGDARALASITNDAL